MMKLYYRLWSLILNVRFGYLRKRQIALFRGGSLFVNGNASFNLNDGFLFINRKHFVNNYRPQAGLLCVERDAKFQLDSDHFSICEGARVHVREGAFLHLEGKGFINTSTEIDVYNHIFIGHGTIISSHCYITDCDQHHLFVDGKQIPNCQPIHIGRNVWIGRNVTILKGVAIGDNAVIASNSLVNTEVPANQLWAGIPARKIKENVHWEF